MFIVNSYALAIALCVVTMLCWGSWGNTQKLAGKTWRYELFYWDYVIGILIFSLIMGFTLGSIGEQGRSFVPDLMQVTSAGMLSAIIGGVVFNLSNILLSASTALAGLSVAFPLGVGLALVIGVFNTYFFVGGNQGNPMLIFGGVALIVLALVFNGIASAKQNSAAGQSSSAKKGVILAIVAGVLMSTFYTFVASAMDIENFENPVAVEFIKADAGLDIGQTLIGMHLKHVAVPVRLSEKMLGDAVVTAARTRAKFIGGSRAIYEYEKEVRECP